MVEFGCVGAEIKWDTVLVVVVVVVWFLHRKIRLRNGGGPLSPPTLVVNQLDPDMIKRAVFDVRDWTQKVINANGGYIEKVKEGYSDVMK